MENDLVIYVSLAVLIAFIAMSLVGIAHESVERNIDKMLRMRASKRRMAEFLQRWQKRRVRFTE